LNRVALFDEEPNPIPFQGDERQDFISRLQSNLASDAVEQELIDAIRLTANRNPLVGPDCMAILLPAPSFKRVRARYVPVLEQQATIQNDRGKVDVRAAFSPWIIGPGVVAPPAMIAGSGWHVGVGDLRVIFEAPDATLDGRSISYMGSQTRPPAPG
jgi:hypothetical protein